MSTPRIPTPAQLAAADQAWAWADHLINETLTEIGLSLDAGLPFNELTAGIGGGLLGLELTEVQTNIVAVRLLARLARLHHSLGQLSGTWSETAQRARQEAAESSVVGHRAGQAAALTLAASALRKLVETDG